jgi:hypothetical protein
MTCTAWFVPEVCHHRICTVLFVVCVAEELNQLASLLSSMLRLSNSVDAEQHACASGGRKQQPAELTREGNAAGFCMQPLSPWATSS